MGIDDIIKTVAKRINGGGSSLSHMAKLYDAAKTLADAIDSHNKAKQVVDDMNVNPIIQALEEQFGENSAKLLTIQNYEKLKGLRFGGEYKVHSAHESIGNYTFVVESWVHPHNPNNSYHFRLRRVPEVKDLKLYRLTLDNKAFVTLPRKIIESPSLLMKEMYELILAESTPLPF
jgi:hypothetical protein